jgi:predicted dehydrogenase
MSGPIRWGILGGGNIARKFARGLQSLTDARLAAVASRSPEKLQEFSTAYGATRLYETYEALVSDPQIDIIYVATTNQLHASNTSLCLQAGKPVLCEKPFALSADEARQVIDLARRQRLFCMEAMWTRCLPLLRALPALLKSGSIGDVRMVKADFGSLPPFDKDNRFFNPALGGGAMFDLGIYLLSLASYLLGPPESVVSQASIGATGVDEQSAALLGYASGKMAIVSCSLVTRLPTEARIIGTRGQIRIHSPVHCPRELTLTTYPDLEGHAVSTDKQAKGKPLSALLGRVKRKLHATRDAGVSSYPFEGNGYQFEAQEAMRCLRSGEIESAIMPLGETLEIMNTIDEIRRQWKASRFQEVV